MHEHTIPLSYFVEAVLFGLWLALVVWATISASQKKAKEAGDS